MKSARRKTAKGTLLLCLAVSLWLGGCQGGNVSWYGPDPLEKDYGNSYRNNLAQSVLNPRAGLNDVPTAGLGPNSATNEMDRYEKSFKGEGEKKGSELKISY